MDICDSCERPAVGRYEVTNPVRVRQAAGHHLPTYLPFCDDERHQAAAYSAAAIYSHTWEAPTEIRPGVTTLF